MKKFIPSYLIAIFIAFGGMSNAFGNNMDDLLDMDLEDLLQMKFVTIATGTEQTVAEAAAVTSVITSDDIKAMGATDLDEILESIPGMHVARNAMGYSPIYVMRGIHSEYNPEVLILVNGLPINTVQTGNRGLVWAGMPVKSIARIEVIRGPGSAVYGADAFAGVVNIITKNQADIDGTEVGARIGRFNTKDAWALHGKKYGDFDVAVMLEYHDTDGHRGIVTEDAQTQNDAVFGTDVSLAPGPVNMSRQNIDARLDVGYGNWRLRTGYQGRYDVGTGAGLAQALDPLGRYSSERFNTDINYHNKDVENWVFDAQAAVFYTNYEAENNQRAFPPGVRFGTTTYEDGYIGNPGVSERHGRINLSAIYSGFDKHALRFGTGYHYADMYKVTETRNFGVDPKTGLPLTTTDVIVDLSGTKYAFLPEKDRSSYYVFIQDTWDISEKWQLTTGLRYDDYSDFGTTINPRLAIVWKPNDSLITKLLYGSAFRAPAFVQLYVINNPVTLGNPSLNPESIETLELAFNYKINPNFNTSLNLFRYEINDAIRYVNTESNEAIAENAGSQKGNGFELEAEWLISNKFNVIGNYAFQNSSDGTGAKIANAPRHQLYLRGNWNFHDVWHLNAQLNWVGDRSRVQNDPRPKVDSYTTLDLTLYGEIKENLALKASVRNLFDANGYEPSEGPDFRIRHDLPIAGRNYYLEFSYKF